MAVNYIQSVSRFEIVLRFSFLSLFLTLGFAATFSQTPQPTQTPQQQTVEDVDTRVEKVRTDLVTLTLTVTDIYGRYVSGLTKNAFTVFDNGEEQEISYFSDTDAPVSLGILFDVSDSMSGTKIGKARKA